MYAVSAHSSNIGTMLTITTDLRRYVAAIAAVLITAALRFMLDPIMGAHLPFYLFYFMVFITALIAGPGPGVFALALSTLTTAYLFLDPRELAPLQGESLIKTFRFVSLGALLVVAGSAVRALRLRLDLETKERLRAEEMTRHALDNALRVLASVGDGLMTTDDRGRITFMNAVAEEITGWHGGDAIGRYTADVFRIVHAGTNESIPDPVARSLREARVVSIPPHTMLIRRDGSQRAVADSAAPIRDAQGRIVGSILVFRGTEPPAQDPPTAGFEIVGIDLAPIDIAQVPLNTELLQRLEQKCRIWLLQHWELEDNKVRIVAIDDVQVLIHQEYAVLSPSGTIQVRFRVAYEHWSPKPVA